MDEKDEAEFVRKYGQEVVDNGYEAFAKLAKDKKSGQEQLNHEKAKQDQNFTNYNKDFNKNKKYDHETPQKNFNKKIAEDEAAIAKEFGHVTKELSTGEKIKDNKKEMESNPELKSAEKLEKPKLAAAINQENNIQNEEREKFIAMMKENARSIERQR